jgi:hypothetical protein
MYKKTATIRPLLVCLAIAAVGSLSCSKDTPTSPTATGSSTTMLSVTSEPVSMLGQGRSYNLQNATFRALSMRSGGAMDITVRPTDPADKSGPWTLLLGSPFGRGFAPGTYSTTPFETDGGWGLNLLNGNVDCYSGMGTVTIHEIVITQDVVQRFRASFSMRCTGSGTLRGEVVALADPWR